MTHTHITRALAVSSAALALTAALAGCQPRTAVTTTGTAPTTTVASDATPQSAEGSPQNAQGSQAATSTGSLTVSISAPVSVAGTATTAVTCVTGRHYRASASSAVIDGAQLSFVVAVAGYRGAGSYPAVVDVTLRQSTGRVTTVAGVPNIPAVLSATGGSFTLSATGEEGRTFTGSVTWVCGS